MAFEVIKKGKRGVRTPKNEIRVEKGGRTFISKEALAEVGITDRAVVMIDKGTCRIGLRPPNEEDHEDTIYSVYPSGKSAHTMGISLVTAIRAVGVEPLDAKGKHKIMIMTKQQLICWMVDDA